MGAFVVGRVVVTLGETGTEWYNIGDSYNGSCWWMVVIIVVVIIMVEVAVAAIAAAAAAEPNMLQLISSLYNLD